MVTVRHIIITVLVAVAAIITFIWFFTGNEAKIKKQFKTLAALATKDSDEHPFMAAASARNIGDMFAKTCRIEIPSHSMSKTVTRENIPAHIIAARSRYSAISLKFHDIKISFPEKDISRVTFTAYAETMSASGELIQEVHEFVSRMEKVEKKWYFNQIEAISVMER
jgi:hypothetical protein